MSAGSIEAVIRSGRFVMVNTDEGTVVLPLDAQGKLVRDGNVVESSLGGSRRTYEVIVKIAGELLSLTGNTAATEADEERNAVQVHAAFVLGALAFAPNGASREQLNEAYAKHHRAIHETGQPEKIAAAKMLEVLRKGAASR